MQCKAPVEAILKVDLYGTADEVANVEELLISPAGSFITDSTILIDGAAAVGYYFEPLKQQMLNMEAACRAAAGYYYGSFKQRMLNTAAACRTAAEYIITDRSNLRNNGKISHARIGCPCSLKRFL